MKRELESCVATTLATLDRNRVGTTLNLRIGEILMSVGKLVPEQVARIRASQTQSARFGATAVALGLVSDADVHWALSQQFQYPYARASGVSDRPGLVVATDPFGAQAEVIRDVRSRLLMGVLSKDQPRRALAVVSPNRGDGKTFFAANLAVSMSQLGARTLLVDAAMRSPGQHHLFGLRSPVGLSSILAGRSEAALAQPADLPNLFVLPVGTLPPNPLELVQSGAFESLISGFLTKFDFVLVDTPAAALGADVRVIAATCGAALAIGRQDKTRLSSMQSLLESLSSASTKIAGVVMNQH